MSYAELQREQAEEIMGGVAGGPGEQPQKKKKGEGKKAAHKGQPTGPKDLLRHNVEKQAESSESESDLDEKPTGPDPAVKKQLFEQRRHDVGLADEGKDDRTKSVDSIAKDALLSGVKPSEEDYAGRNTGQEDTEELQEQREQEKDNFVQEELYIHGKVSISAGNALLQF